MFDLHKYYSHFSDETTILIALSLILFAGYLLTWITRQFKLPNVTGYILAGIVIGPYALNAVPPELIKKMGFVSDMALAFIAFGVGKYLKREALQKSGPGVLVITMTETLVPAIMITLSMRYLLGLDWMMSLLLGAIAMATAPASTLMTINQYGAKGSFVNTLLQVVALDDVVCLLGFSAIMVLVNSGGEAVSKMDIALPIIYNIVAIIAGFFCGFLLVRLIVRPRSAGSRLILALAMLLAISGICNMLQISPLLACMALGTTYKNFMPKRKLVTIQRNGVTIQKKDPSQARLFKQISNFIPPIMAIFFIVSGMNFDLSVLASAGVIGVSYFFIRIIGKYIGAYLGCHLMRYDASIKNYLGLALVPQAGVAIGLAFMGQRILKPEYGDILLTIILASSVLYEIVGPACAKLALIWSGAIPPGTKDKYHETKEELS